ncbi:MAG: YceI family protein [Candidatus Sericytochromatia bacterium]
MTATNPLFRLTLAAALGGLALAAAVPVAFAQGAGGLTFAPAGKIWLTGDSTLHAYTSTAKQYQASVGSASRSAAGVTFSDLEVVIPVQAMKSGEGALDDNMYKALQAAKFATIRFSAPTGTLRQVRPGVIEADVKGQLSIAGTTRATSLKATGTLTGNTLKLKGTKELTMSEFGVKPPVILGGMIKCSDRIVVHFDLAGQIKE